MARVFVEWTDDLSIGIQEIDEQHKVLIDLINRLFHETIINHVAIDVTEGILQELIECTTIHFSLEESLFRIFDYPEIDKHSVSHVDLKAQILELQQKIKQGEALNGDLFVFLKKWLTNHIVNEDKQYAPFLIQQGVRSSWAKKSWLGKIWK